MADPTGVSPQFWLEWSRVTRFMESSRIAFTREASLWNGLELKDGPSKMKLLVPTGKGKYSVTLEQHLETLADQTMLFAGVLMHSYARAESAAADKLGVDLRRLSGIEDWGSRLLEAASASWTDVPGGRAGQSKWRWYERPSPTGPGVLTDPERDASNKPEFTIARRALP